MSDSVNAATAKKPFFKSTAFKCIAVLLVIVLISGIFLTICNSLFYVSDDERLNRALAKLYTDGETVTSQTLEVDGSVSVEDATIDAVYQITSIDGEYVLKVTGKNGFQGGTVTCYVRVYLDTANSTCEIKTISISSNTSQSYISNITSSHLEGLVSQQESGDFSSFDSTQISTGASYSFRAVANAANGALTYMNAKYLGVVVEDPYADFIYLDYIYKSSINISYSATEGTVTYTELKLKAYDYTEDFTVTIVVNSDKKIQSYTVVVDGSTKKGSTDYATINYIATGGSYVGYGASDLLSMLDLTNDAVVDGSTIDAGASLSDFLLAYAALFATANYDNSVEVSQ